jgi:hypothetical protein
MGICKCKKRTDLFCFVHKKAVCEQCICSDHQVCVVKSYVDWLTDSEYEPPVCGICKGELSQDNMVRFLCLDMFHPECIDVYASSLPPHTAQAGYGCPTCSKPMIPPQGSTSPLAQHIKQVLSRSSWAARLMPDGDTRSAQDNLEINGNPAKLSPSSSSSNLSDDFINHPPSPTPSSASLSAYTPTPIQSTQDSTATTNTQPVYYTPLPAPPVITPNPSLNQSQPTYSQQMSTNIGMTPPYGIASRKPQRSSNLPLDDEDEDKYRRKGIMQLFAALGLVSKHVGSDSKRGVHLDPRRLLALFALMATFATVLVLYLLITQNEPEITTTDS